VSQGPPGRVPVCSIKSPTIVVVVAVAVVALRLTW